MYPVIICPQIERDHRDARFNADDVAHARDTIAFYERRPDVEPYTTDADLRHRLALASCREAECLRLISRNLRESGLAVGQTVEIDGHLYRVTSERTPAVHLGKLPPSDEIPMEASEALDDALWGFDEAREWNSDYLRSVAIN